MRHAGFNLLPLGGLAAAAIVTIGAGDRFALRERAVAVQRVLDAASPRVSRVRPGEGERAVLPNASIVVDLAWPGDERRDGPDVGSAVDPDSMKAGVRLIDAAGRDVAAHMNTSAAGDSVVLTPTEPLRLGDAYRVVVDRALRDVRGDSFIASESSFSVTAHAHTQSLPVAFERVRLQSAEGRPFTALAIGPDGRLYAATIDGSILKFDIGTDGQLTLRRTIQTLVVHNGGPRLITGFAFDPRAPVDALRLWVSHGQLAPFVGGQMSGADEWTGAISVLDGDGFARCRDAVVGLPRAFKDHLNFQPAFGPDGALYFNQGSHTSSGSPDAKWGMRPERSLSAAVLRLDVDRLGDGPIDVRTDGFGAYAPASTGAPLTIYATGVRSAFDLLWHSSGRLYSAVNGAAAGGVTPARSPSGDVPGLAPIRSVRADGDDVLIEIERGRYYGAPNPTRGELVLHGGNPTAAVDPYEVAQYPVGTQPDPRWKMPTFNFGKSISPDGLIEYRSDAFGGALRGAILVCRYSAGDDLVALRVDAGGAIVDEIVGIRGLTGLADPLDVVEDPRNGNLYVSEFGARRITLLRPVPGSTSDVYVRPAR